MKCVVNISQSEIKFNKLGIIERIIRSKFFFFFLLYVPHQNFLKDFPVIFISFLLSWYCSLIMHLLKIMDLSLMLFFLVHGSHHHNPLCVKMISS